MGALVSLTTAIDSWLFGVKGGGWVEQINSIRDVKVHCLVYVGTAIEEVGR